jgi:hypothetical protein
MQFPECRKLWPVNEEAKALALRVTTDNEFSEMRFVIRQKTFRWGRGGSMFVRALLGMRAKAHGLCVLP